MAKYVKCIQGDFGVPLTEGNCYKVINSNKVGHLVQDDEGHLEWWSRDRFGEPYELPEPITFSSQEEFEDAVMAVIMERLEVFSYSTDKWGNELQELCAMRDDK